MPVGRSRTHTYDDEAFRIAYEKVLAKWPADREALTVATPFGATRVNACGPRDAPPLLLLPGGGSATSVSWYAQAADLARVRRVHAPDLIGAPGLGAPAGDRHPRTVADLVGWVDALLDGLGAEAADVGGHSYGAWIALHHALRSPPGCAACSSWTRPGASPGTRRRTCSTPCRCCCGPRRAASAPSCGGRPGERPWIRTGSTSRRRPPASRQPGR
ncbi:alpha/beta fold hydrolase [Streptomyces sp. NPDC090073]|uniref:alpha/beta fold hydrolase n=1 Tax=Streptomyces sp. NPDC090073 TaxID=3365936 RepID=UPI0038071D25